MALDEAVNAAHAERRNLVETIRRQIGQRSRRQEGRIVMTLSRKCKCCGTQYTPTRPMQKVCSVACAVSLSLISKAKNERLRDRIARAKLKTRAQWMREAQAAFNRWVRLRDKDQPCISCQRHHAGKVNAGHYRSTAAAPELRFEPLNVHLQCEPCNSHLSGNVVEYRKNLIARIGMEKVIFLEGPHDPKKYTIDDLRIIKARYAHDARELEKGL